MKKVLSIIALMMAVAIQAKTTYIPTYLSYLHIVTDKDTLSTVGNLDTLSLADPGGMFVLRFDHEDVTKEKVKAIKRAKRAAGWATFSAVLGGVSTAFSDNSLQYMIRSNNTRISTDVAAIYNVNAIAEQTLEIEFWIDNTSGHELMVCDMDRGLTWWILPRYSMRLKFHNPDASRLRISDPQSNRVRYTSAVAGSKVTKWEVDMETDEYWYSAVYKEPNMPHDNNNLSHIIRIDKANYEEVRMKKEDYWTMKKAMKKKN